MKNISLSISNSAQVWCFKMKKSSGLKQKVIYKQVLHLQEIFVLKLLFGKNSPFLIKSLYCYLLVIKMGKKLSLNITLLIECFL